MTLVRLGLRENLAQFSLLVVVNLFVGALVGMERSILPVMAEQEFHLAARTAVLSFIVVFGATKALTNYFAGRLSDRFGRKQALVAGWLVAAPVPFLLMWAPGWNWVLLANVLLGVSQGLTWSTTVIMKIDLVGPKNRGLAMGLNEFAGYVAVAASALATGFIAARYGFRPEPFYLGVGFVVFGLTLSALAVRDTVHHVAAESEMCGVLSPENVPTQSDVFWRTTLRDRNLSSVSQAGLVNNLNDGMAWGVFPLFFAAAHMDLEQIGTLAAVYPATWGRRSAFHGGVVRSNRQEVAHHLRHVGAGRWHRSGYPGGRIFGFCLRCRAPRDRHCDGIPDTACRNRRCRPSDVESVVGRRISALARPRLCHRRPAGRCDGRCARTSGGDVVGRSSDLRLRAHRSGTYDGNARRCASAPSQVFSGQSGSVSTLLVGCSASHRPHRTIRACTRESQAATGLAVLRRHHQRPTLRRSDLFFWIVLLPVLDSRDLRENR
jgi:MFS family permease